MSASIFNALKHPAHQRFYNEELHKSKLYLLTYLLTWRICNKWKHKNKKTVTKTISRTILSHRENGQMLRFISAYLRIRSVLIEEVYRMKRTDPVCLRKSQKTTRLCLSFRRYASIYVAKLPNMTL